MSHSCLLLLSLGVADGTSVSGVQVTLVQVMGIFFGMCYDVWLKNQVTVLEAWEPRLAGGGIGYHGLSCHGKVYEDECRIASCEVSPCEVERYGTQSDRSDAYADDSSAEQPGLIFFSGLCLLVSRSKVSRSSTSGGGGYCHE